MDFYPSDTHMIRMFDAFKLPRVISIPLYKLVKKWFVSMGPETTVSRLKTVKSLYLGVPIETLDAPWIAFHKDGTPKGALRPLFKHTTRKFRTKVLNSLMVYSGYKASKLTDAQWNKFYNSFTAPPSSIEEVRSVLPRLEEESERFFFMKVAEWDRSEYSDPYDWTASPTKRTMAYDTPNFVGEFTPSKGFYRDVEANIPFDDMLSVLDSTEFEFIDPIELEIYTEATGGAFPASVLSEDAPPPFVGSLSIIQERGMKARIVANPFRVHQMALSKLGNFMFSMLRLCRWDCTFDQKKGQRFIQRNLERGKTVYCFDLSDATNNIPIEVYQLAVSGLTQKSVSFDASMRLFNRLSKGNWLVPNSPIGEWDSEYIQCTKGQPLGLYPSFAFLSFGHGLVIQSIEREFGISNTFRVLGDDVVIVNKLVADRYSSVMNSLKVPISNTKSIISNEIGEFAGKVVTKEGTFPVEKWKTFSTTDPLSIFRWLGLDAMSLVPKALRPAMRLWISLPEPVGLGINPKGLSYDDRVVPDFDDLYLKAWYDPGAIQMDSLDKRERRRDAIIAFNFLGGYKPTLQRQLRAQQKEAFEHLEISHINACLSEYGWLPPQWEELFYKYCRKPSRITHSKEAKPKDNNLLIWFIDYCRSHQKECNQF